MNLHDLLLVHTAYALTVAGPGPSNMAIMNTAMRHGRPAALAMAANVVTMSTVWGTVAATGVSTLLANYAHALTVLRVGGGLYLRWLAWKAAQSVATPSGRIVAIGDATPDGWSCYRRGVPMHVGNPKAVLARLSIMSLGVSPDATPATVALAVAGCVALGVVIVAGHAFLFSTARMVRAYACARRWFEGVLAIFFAGAGIRLLLSR